MIEETKLMLLDLVMCLSDVVDLVAPAVANHHKQVAYIAFCLGRELGFSMKQRTDLVLAGALHDIGALSLKDKIDVLRFEDNGFFKHADLSYSLLKMFEPLSGIADIVRFHHVSWSDMGKYESKGIIVPMDSHILHLADRVSVLIDKRKEILGQVSVICKKIEKQSGEMFMPEIVDAFMRLSVKENFWFQVASQSISSLLIREIRQYPNQMEIEMDAEALLGVSRLFSKIIDFRSHYTSTHSSGVAASAEALARLAGFSDQECQMMKVAGYLHDLGKLAVPTEILEKPAKLTKKEINIIRSHTFHTCNTLHSIHDFAMINTWASSHHERLSGDGYPFHIKAKDLSLGSRIMAVADVFTAITEDRPYRKGMPDEKALQVLQDMADNSLLDPGVVSLLRLHFEEINSLRIAAQKASNEDYKQFLHSPN